MLPHGRKVTITYDFDDEARRAISNHTGKIKPATRKDLATWMEKTIHSTLDDVVADYIFEQDTT